MLSHRVSVVFRAIGLFSTFVEVAVVVRCACISKSLDYSLRYQLVHAGLSAFKKKKKKNQIGIETRISFC